MDNLFFTNSIMIRQTLPYMLKDSPAYFHDNDEAIKKMHSFCHELYKIPITWLVDHASMLKYADLLKEYIEKYNDEVAILEWGIATKDIIGDDAKEYQPWVESAEIKRPDKFQIRDEMSYFLAFCDMSDEDIDKAIKFFAEDFRRVFGRNMSTFANAFIDERTVKACKKYGIKNIWGYNWNYFCEGINNKGCPPGPFYISDENHNKPGDSKECIIGIHWGACSHLIQYETDKFGRAGGPGHCLNVMELTNKSYGLDKIDFHKKVIREYAENAKRNSIIHIPLQIEAVWISEDTDYGPFGSYDNYPLFNSANTESYYTELEECMAVGAKGVTIKDLCEYMRENVSPKHKYIFYSKDLVPHLRHKGKDSVWDTFLVYKDQNYQYWFEKQRKFNYIRKYDYNSHTENKDLCFFDEYPYESEPEVALKAKAMMNPTGGIVIKGDEVFYELGDFSLTSRKDYKDYACVLWQGNIPSFVSDDDIEIGGFINSFIADRDKNTVLLFGDLKTGLNDCIFRSDKPKEFIKIVRQELVGTRYEIWIENKGDQCELYKLETIIDTGLALGGYWWNGEYNHSIFRYGQGWYHQRQGNFFLHNYYPKTLTLKKGLNRLSLQTV